jgi:hypothetical protein
VLRRLTPCRKTSNARYFRSGDLRMTPRNTRRNTSPDIDRATLPFATCWQHLCLSLAAGCGGDRPPTDAAVRPRRLRGVGLARLRRLEVVSRVPRGVYAWSSYHGLAMRPTPLVRPSQADSSGSRRGDRRTATVPRSGPTKAVCGRGRRRRSPSPTSWAEERPTLTPCRRTQFTMADV